MGSVAEATASLGQTIQQMAPLMFQILVMAPLQLSLGIDVL
ncbi:hypothetical protein AB4Z09_24475 [Rhodococcus sp. TAF43]